MATTQEKENAIRELKERQDALAAKRAELAGRLQSFQRKSMRHMESWLNIQSHVDQISKWEAHQNYMMVQWINHHLSRVSHDPISGLRDLRDGNVLCSLMEALSERKIPQKRIAKCAMKVQRINNLNIAFNRIKEEGVKLVNVGPEDIEGCHKKSLMGMVWQLIEFYQLNINWKKTKPAADEKKGEEADLVENPGAADSATDGEVAEASGEVDTEDELHEWAASCCRPFGLESSWDLDSWIADGRVFGAITAFLDPTFDFNALIHERKPFANMTSAFQHCQEQLNVPQLVRLTPDMEDCDRVEIPPKVVTTQFAVMRQRAEQPEKFVKVQLGEASATIARGEVAVQSMDLGEDTAAATEIQMIDSAAKEVEMEQERVREFNERLEAERLALEEEEAKLRKQQQELEAQLLEETNRASMEEEKRREMEEQMSRMAKEEEERQRRDQEEKDALQQKLREMEALLAQQADMLSKRRTVKQNQLIFLTKSKVSGDGMEQAFVRERAHFVIEPLDDKGNPVLLASGDFGAVVRRADDSDDVLDNARDLDLQVSVGDEDGLLHVSYRYDKVGELLWDLRLREQSLFTVPRKVPVNAREQDLSGTTLRGDGLKKAIVAEVAEFVVDPRDGGGNQQNVDVSQVSVMVQYKDVAGADPVAVDVRENEDGTFQVLYEPKKIGQVEIVVTIDGKSVGGSPVDVMVEKSFNVDDYLKDDDQWVVEAESDNEEEVKEEEVKEEGAKEEEAEAEKVTKEGEGEEKAEKPLEASQLLSVDGVEKKRKRSKSSRRADGSRRHSPHKKRGSKLEKAPSKSPRRKRNVSHDPSAPGKPSRKRSPRPSRKGPTNEKVEVAKDSGKKRYTVMARGASMSKLLQEEAQKMALEEEVKASNAEAEKVTIAGGDEEDPIRAALMRKKAAFDRLQFSITYSKTKLSVGQTMRVVLQVKDSMTGSIIRQIPGEEIDEAYLEIDSGRGDNEQNVKIADTVPVSRPAFVVEWNPSKTGRYFANVTINGFKCQAKACRIKVTPRTIGVEISERMSAQAASAAETAKVLTQQSARPTGPSHTTQKDMIRQHQEAKRAGIASVAPSAADGVYETGNVGLIELTTENGKSIGFLCAKPNGSFTYQSGDPMKFISDTAFLFREHAQRRTIGVYGGDLAGQSKKVAFKGYKNLKSNKFLSRPFFGDQIQGVAIMHDCECVQSSQPTWVIYKSGLKEPRPFFLGGRSKKTLMAGTSDNPLNMRLRTPESVTIRAARTVGKSFGGHRK
eukprot:CAMPEP_0119126266 /NCGR_PEP_ID=MMETSP1310-20130426/5257_1 /TAXON_ID=464262 /ORGANISM="Genus nov. species nov., Strain RCC2339" /LENGTH=1252 /DNA_ID=CAMNT_0007116419 /DNA_START=70 /DNA_END=3828 /DNA_ORIENTATION=+